ncbi:lipoprotein [Carnobacterium gallinarum]|uniref:lipoprotein n=1 Tax=Carnobacterium gallinarum TaxID=2749 RepID=UPI00055964D8|nr:lipoprotein [Carnobacterium gallinarum]
MLKKIVLTAGLLFLLAGCQQTNEKTESVASKTEEKSKKMATNKMNETGYQLALEDAKNVGLNENMDDMEVTQIEKIQSFDTVKSIKDLESKTEVGIQGLIVASDPSIDIDENLIASTGRTRLTILVNQVFYGDQSLVGQTMIVDQPTGFVKKSQFKSEKETSSMSEAELNEKELIGLNGIGPATTGTELIAYLSPNDQVKAGELPNYVFYGVSLSRFDKDEKTGKYQQVVAPNSEQKATKLNKEINALVK